jgi:nucleoside-diphosphate-sugar epimerase
MAHIPRKILVFGATGLIGRHITDALLSFQESFDKIGIFTSPSSLDRKQDVFDTYRAQGAAIIVGDLQNEHDVEAAYKSKPNNSPFPGNVLPT